MKTSTRNQIAGRAREAKGKVKEKLGRLTNDPVLEDQGVGDKVSGKVQKTIGRAQKLFGR